MENRQLLLQCTALLAVKINTTCTNILLAVEMDNSCKSIHTAGVGDGERETELSPASALLSVVNCLSPASAFRWRCSRINSALPNYGK
jgi:hypothetical protein